MNVKASKSNNSTKLTLSDYNSQQMLPSNNNNKHNKFNQSTGTADEGIEMKQQPIRPSSSLSSTSSTTSSFSRPASRNSNYSPSKVLPSSSSFFNMATSPCDSGIDSVGTSPCSDSGLKNSNASPFVEPAPPAPKDIPFNPIKNAMLGSSNNSLVSSSQTSHHHLPTDPRLKRITTPTSNRSGTPLNNATTALSSPLSSRSPRGSIFQSKNNNITVNESSRTNNNKAQSSNCSPFRSPEPPTSINHTIQNANPVMTSTIAAAAHNNNNNTNINNNQPILLKIPAFARSPQVRTHIRRVKQLTRMKRVLPRDPMFAADYFDGMIRKQARLDELSTSSDNQHTSST